MTIQAGDKKMELLLKYDGSAPRYTSYPPANFFTQNPDDVDYQALLIASNSAGPRNLSFYVHVPFCPRRCLYCGCNTEVGRDREFISGYMEDLHREFRLLLPHLDRSRPVTQIHFGGGTPNAVPYSSLKSLLHAISSEFDVSPAVEIAIECDPVLITPSKLRELRSMGFNRISFGIQDVNPGVLRTVKRRPARMEPGELVRTSRDLGFSGINLDLIFGLPYQTPESFRDTAAAIIGADPDRISLFPFAYVPWMQGHQAALEAFPRPDAPTRIRIANESREAFERAGYTAIGMDHFAKPDDELSLAKRQGTLHRNFQGYCVLSRAGQVHALGASGITQLHQGYFQNEKDAALYRTRLKSGVLPFARAYRMQPRDIAVRAIVNGLLCNGRADLKTALSAPELESAWKDSYRIASLGKLAPFIEDGLVVEENGIVTLTEAGLPLARTIAAAFDPLMNLEDGRPRYSRAL
jgi:oxygen-independent coproporphyrinogen III oxidase